MDGTFKCRPSMERITYHLRNEFNFSNSHGIMNTSGLLQSTELSETQNYAYWYARFFPGTHEFR